MNNVLFEEILAGRGIVGEEARNLFLSPDYSYRHNPFLLPDMDKAVDRLVLAREGQEKITIYGDYDIDGLTASTVLIDSFESFGFENVDVFIPNRFVEGYGLTIDAIELIAGEGTKLIVTVDCGSLSEKEIVRAGELGVDVIVTDHHNVADVQPPAVAVVNPKRLVQEYPEYYEGLLLKASGENQSSADAVVSSRSKSTVKSLQSAELAKAQTSSTGQDSTVDSLGLNKASLGDDLYPFLDLAGVGVAFKLVQALQTRLEGLPEGQEKWLLDLVALGTVCDIVRLVDENRTNVYWGLKVLAKTRRPGLKALMKVAGVDAENVTARSLGFALGPRMNAAGRLETARYALEMLRAKDDKVASDKATLLDEMNRARRVEQDRIFEEAQVQAEELLDDPVLVVSSPGWSHGIIGIVAAKLLEKYKKPTYVLEEIGKEAKGSARSYGDFSAADAIRSAGDIITKGGGHAMAAGVTLPTQNIPLFRERVNDFYHKQKLTNQQDLLLPQEDVSTTFSYINDELIGLISLLEPFGNGNPQPIFKTNNTTVINQRRIGADGQHVRLDLRDSEDATMQMIAFSAPESFFVEPGTKINVWYQPEINEWNGRRSVEGRLLHLEKVIS
jgi:single-stranded-DNA-specific exonuclease